MIKIVCLSLFFIFNVAVTVTVGNDEIVLRCTCEEAEACFSDVGKEFSCGSKNLSMEFPSKEHKFFTDCSIKKIQKYYCTPAANVNVEPVYVSKSIHLPLDNYEKPVCFAQEMIKCFHRRFQCDIMSADESLAKTYARCLSQTERAFPDIRLYNVTFDPHFKPVKPVQIVKNGSSRIGIQSAMAFLFVIRRWLL